ncbi:MAG TPA: exopolysaccharide biosynthesis polyprenyl glycosylphosphotransferase [Candidatus Kryptonia bacterium]
MAIRIAAYKFTLLLIDLLVVYLCFMGSTWLRFGYIQPRELFPAVILTLVSGFIFQYNSLYKINVFLDRSASAILLLKSMIAIAVVYIVGGFMTKFIIVVPSRLAFAYFFASLLFAFWLYRIVILPAVFDKIGSSGVRRRRVLVVGAGNAGRRFASAIELKKGLGLQIVGFADDTIPAGTGVLNGFRVLGDTSSLDYLVHSNSCNEIVIAIDNISHSRMLSLIEQAKLTGSTVKVVSNLFETITEVTTTEAYTIHPTVTVTRGLYSSVTKYYQRISDIILALIGLTILLPFFVIASIAIKLTSKGPVLYPHDRVGMDGELFKMYKFRSMYVSDKEDTKRKEMMLEFMKGNGSKVDKVIDHARVTWVGRLMRAMTFDEMPQLFNVLKGDMSLVGPRPVLPYEYESFKDWHHQRDRVLPGCTGFWQVHGRSKTSFDDMVVMDLYMIENMSPWLYLELILKTIPAIIFKRGAK